MEQGVNFDLSILVSINIDRTASVINHIDARDLTHYKSVCKQSICLCKQRKQLITFIT